MAKGEPEAEGRWPIADGGFAIISSLFAIFPMRDLLPSGRARRYRFSSMTDTSPLISVGGVIADVRRVLVDTENRFFLDASTENETFKK